MKNGETRDDEMPIRFSTEPMKAMVSITGDKITIDWNEVARAAADPKQGANHFWAHTLLYVRDGGR